MMQPYETPWDPYLHPVLDALFGGVTHWQAFGVLAMLVALVMYGLYWKLDVK
jgi:hypothetical protein